MSDFQGRPFRAERASQLELLLRQVITRYILREQLEGYLGSLFIEQLALEIAEALRADARALGKKLGDLPPI